MAKNVIHIYTIGDKKLTLTYNKVINTPTELVVEEKTLDGERLKVFQKINILYFEMPGKIEVSKIVKPSIIQGGVK